MAWLPSGAPNSTDGKMIRSPTGNAMFVNGAFYILQSPASAVVNTLVETSILGGDTSTTSPITVQLGIPPFAQYPGSTRVFPPGSLAAGTMFNLDFYGAIKNTGTPGLQIRLGLVNSAGTFTALADTTLTTMTTEGSLVWLHVNGGFSVQSYGTAGVINGWIGYEYAPTSISVFSPLLNTAAFDTTQQYTLDVRATWSAASSSNTLQLSYGAIEVIG